MREGMLVMTWMFISCLQALREKKGLLVNLVSQGTFCSHQLNRDTWSDPSVVATVEEFFVFVQKWVVHDDNGAPVESSFLANAYASVSDPDVRRLCNLYSPVNLPWIVLIDPLTGLKCFELEGFVAPDRLQQLLGDFVGHFEEQTRRQLKNTLLRDAETIDHSPGFHPQTLEGVVSNAPFVHGGGGGGRDGGGGGGGGGGGDEGVQTLSEGTATPTYDTSTGSLLVRSSAFSQAKS